MIVGYCLALVIGLTLGILGGGGSILTVPILIYVLDFEAKKAIAMSLFIVGATAAVGSYRHWRAGNVNFSRALLLGISAFCGSFVGAKYIATYLTSTVQMTLFAVTMLSAALLMYRGRGYLEKTQESPPLTKPSFVIIMGICVGILTGIIGVGGGFLLVPVLVLGVKVPMREAIGTSLLIITMNTISGIIGYHGQFEYDWKFMAIFSSISIVGILIGSQFIQKVPQRTLKKVFAIFLLIMSVFILIKTNLTS